MPKPQVLEKTKQPDVVPPKPIDSYFKPKVSIDYQSGQNIIYVATANKPTPCYGFTQETITTVSDGIRRTEVKLETVAPPARDDLMWYSGNSITGIKRSYLKRYN